MSTENRPRTTAESLTLTVGQTSGHLVGSDEKPIQAAQILSHVAIRRRDDGGAPAHYVVAAEQRLFLAQREAEMVGRMARRRHRLQRPARSLDLLAIAQHSVGAIVGVERRIGARPVIVQRQRRAACDRRAGPGADRSPPKLACLSPLRSLMISTASSDV